MNTNNINTARLIKETLILLATLDKLPMDMNELDYSLFDKALSNYAPAEGTKFTHKCNLTNEGMNEGYLVNKSVYIKYYIDLVVYLNEINDEPIVYESIILKNDSEFRYIIKNGKLIEIA